MKLNCMMCYKQAVIMAYGNTYCKDCYEKSPYYAEKKAYEDLKHEQEEKKKSA